MRWRALAEGGPGRSLSERDLCFSCTSVPQCHTKLSSKIYGHSAASGQFSPTESRGTGRALLYTYSCHQSCTTEAAASCLCYVLIRKGQNRKLIAKVGHVPVCGILHILHSNPSWLCWPHPQGLLYIFSPQDRGDQLRLRPRTTAGSVLTAATALDWAQNFSLEKASSSGRPVEERAYKSL
uniref:Uncharacterized protein n=1 Tax=Pipistrellus kuhlii TaxID=59472 RepID=A0A7J8B237_PIPKU|nr:hypothetical protein mPipKuh1_007729 [Pipistrellus kuhlii]